MRVVDTVDRFSIADDSVEKVTILGTGNVGIGKTNPASKLDVIHPSETFASIITDTSPAFRVYKAYQDNNDNSVVQVGQFVSARSTYGATANWGGYLSFYTNSSVTTAVNGTENARLTWDGNNKLYLGGGGNKHLTIDSSGNVGIWTTSPYGLLSVEQGTETASLWVGNTGSSTPSLVVRGVNGNGHIGLGVNVPQGNFHVQSIGAVDDFILNQASTTNYISNPSFETNTSGWSLTRATLTRVTTDSKFGTASGQLTASNDAYAYMTYSLGVLPAGTYTASAWFKSAVTNTAASPTGTPGDIFTITAADGWIRRYGTFTADGVSSYAMDVYVNFSGSVSSQTILVDGIQVELASAPTPYADGSLGPGYAWTGTAHGSTSYRIPGAAFGHQSLNMAGGLGAAGRGTSPALRIEQNGTGPVASFFDTATEVLRIADGGNVGIGTTNPGAWLQI